MKWTKEKPKEAGYYWYRIDNWSDRVVQVFEMNCELFVYINPNSNYPHPSLELDDFHITQALWSDVPVDFPE